MIGFSRTDVSRLYSMVKYPSIYYHILVITRRINTALF